MHVGAARGIASGRGGGSGWARMHVNRTDPVEFALAVDLHKSALAHIAGSSCSKYIDVCVGEGRVSRDRLLPED
jgi:hypothetical protein